MTIVWSMDGLCYCVAYLMTGSLWVSTIWHTAHNLGIWIFGFFLVQLIPGIYHVEYGNSAGFITLLYACISGVITIITIVYFFLTKRKALSKSIT